MREIKNTKIIAVDHGYGNIKTANTVTPTGITAYESEPIFTGNILEYNGIYYRIGGRTQGIYAGQSHGQGLLSTHTDGYCTGAQRSFHPGSRCPSGCRASINMDPEAARRIPFYLLQDPESSVTASIIRITTSAWSDAACIHRDTLPS